MKKKIAFGKWFTPFLKMLSAGRRLRGTRLDPFGYAKVRRLERRLPDEYRELVQQAIALRTPENEPLILELLEAPELIRGYEEIKLEGVGRYRDRVAALLREIESGREAALARAAVS